MPEWLLIIIISTVFALVSYIFITEIHNLREIIKEWKDKTLVLEEDLKRKPHIEEVSSLKGAIMEIENDLKKRPQAEETLTLSIHASLCKDNTHEMLAFIKDQTEDLKTFFTMKIENEILKEIRKGNGK